MTSAPACPETVWTDSGRRWRGIWIGSFVVALFLTVWSSISESLWMRDHGAVTHWGHLLTYRSVEELTCALCFPLIFWLVDRFPIDHRPWWRNGAVLLAACYIIAVLKYVVFYPVFLLVWSKPETVAEILMDASDVALSLIAAVGVAHAVRFYNEARERERTALQLRQRLSQAQLEALRSQLQPHFLFNALNGVATLMHWDAAAADEMLTQLADLLRETLRRPGSHEVTLTEELDLLDRYLAVMRVRFHDRLTVRCDIDPAAVDSLVPHFLLQPLVENALEHGIAQRPGPGSIEIAARRDGDRLWISVTDDGPGLATDAAGTGSNGHGSHGNGVGLANIRARLVELYGAAQALTLAPASARGGVCATVALPYHVQPLS
jgi:two-component system, LytTR family, sensor kinase